MMTIPNLHLAAAIFTLSLAIGGCATSAECDPDQEMVDGACVAATGGAGGAISATGGSGGAGGAGQGGAATCDPGEPQAEFGDECADGDTHSDCGCPAPNCAIQPGMQTGYCTQTGCVEDPDVCPEGWGCFDLSQFDPELPSICTRP